MVVRYEGWPGTGLRLQDAENSHRCIDAGGSHGSQGGCTLFVSNGRGQGAKIELDPEDVARLGAMCNQWLAWHLAGRPTER